MRYSLQGNTAAFSADGSLCATGDARGDVRLWRVSDGSLAQVLRGHKGAVYTVKFSPDCRFVASGGADHSVRICRVADGKLVRVLRRHSENERSSTPSQQKRR